MYKNIVTSKSTIAGVIEIVIGILGVLGASTLLVDYAPHILAVSGALSIGLRILTEKPVSFTAPVKLKDLWR